MRFALVDDKKELRDHVAMLLGEFAAEQRLHYKLDCFASGEDFLNHFTAHSYDIIFMDIFMDGMDGVETAEQIRKFDSHVILIFLTSSQDHMKNAFSCHAFDYVEKPVDLEQITNCLLDALKIIPNKDQFFSFLYNNLEIRLMYSEIVCLYADNHSTRIYDVDGNEYRPRMYYGVLAEQLIEDERFLQVSRGVLCNMDHILEMSKRDCKLSCGITVPITMRNATKLKYGCRLVDQLFNARVWYVMVPAPFIFSAGNYVIQPRDYSHLYFGNMFFLYLFVLSGMFLLMLIIYVSFYFVAMELIQSLDQRERIQLMQMQEHQYIAQQTYIEESSRIRHDFRQSAITMLSLAEQNDVEALKNYLQSFVADLPQNEIRAWCRNPSVNALLNYYETLLEMYGVRRQWEISLPDCKISDNDLCGMLGNLLENVYHGCLTAKEGERFHHFSVLLKNERDLYIVSTNSFDDEVRKKDGKYASSRKDGSGIGLSSIRITAEKYNGTARFSHDDKVFYIDVVMEV